jgi:DNA-binding IclR family transcriptional regulator
MKANPVQISEKPQRKASPRRVAHSKNGTTAPSEVELPVKADTKSQRPKSPENGDPYKLEGLDRVVAIMDLLGESDDCLSLAEICKRMELRKSTAHRSLIALERTGLIERAPGNRYRLGLKLYDMGNRAVEQVDLRARANPLLRKLALRVGETVHLGVLHRTRVVYLDKVEPINRRVCVSSRTGTSNPVYSTSMGKAMLAYLTPEEVEKTVSEIQFAPFTSKTITTREELMSALDRVRRRGYAIDDEEMEIGTRCVGAPVLDGEGRPIAAISVSGSASRLAAHCVPGLAVHVLRFAKDISVALGDRNPRSSRSGSSPRDGDLSSTPKKA